MKHDSQRGLRNFGCSPSRVAARPRVEHSSPIRYNPYLGRVTNLGVEQRRLQLRQVVDAHLTRQDYPPACPPASHFINYLARPPLEEVPFPQFANMERREHSPLQGQRSKSRPKHIEQQAKVPEQKQNPKQDVRYLTFSKE